MLAVQTNGTWQSKKSNINSTNMHQHEQTAKTFGFSSAALRSYTAVAAFRSSYGDSKSLPYRRPQFSRCTVTSVCRFPTFKAAFRINCSACLTVSSKQAGWRMDLLSCHTCFCIFSIYLRLLSNLNERADVARQRLAKGLFNKPIKSVGGAAEPVTIQWGFLKPFGRKW